MSAGAVAISSPAMAISRPARCEVNGYVGRAWINFHLDGNWTVFDNFAFEQHGAGNKSDVTVRIKRDVPSGDDPVMYGPKNSGDILDSGEHNVMPIPGGFREANVQQNYVTFEFHFDDSWTDPSCTARTEII